MKATHRNFFKQLLCIALAILAIVTLTGCDSKGNTENTANSASTAAQDSGTNHYVFEAELVDLTDKAGAGPSNAAMETELILKDSKASNGCYIGYTYFADLSFDFAFTSDSAKEATLSIVLGSDLGVVRMNPSVFEISLNGTALDYAELKLLDSSGKINKEFKEFEVGKVTLAEGDNKITLRILENELYNGGTGGPLIDCVMLDTPAVLNWSPVETNVN